MVPLAPRAKLAPLSPDRNALQVTIDDETVEPLEQARDLLSHAAPNADAGPRVSAEVKRQVRACDGDACSFEAPDGNRCGSRYQLEGLRGAQTPTIGRELSSAPQPFGPSHRHREGGLIHACHRHSPRTDSMRRTPTLTVLLPGAWLPTPIILRAESPRPVVRSTRAVVSVREGPLHEARSMDVVAYCGLVRSGESGVALLRHCSARAITRASSPGASARRWPS